MEERRAHAVLSGLHNDSAYTEEVFYCIENCIRFPPKGYIFELVIEQSRFTEINFYEEETVSFVI